MALEGKLDFIVCSEKLENELIHYIHARKLTGKEKKTEPLSHSALLVSEYLKDLKDINSEIEGLYSELCQISHPSFFSLQLFLYENEHGLVFHNENETNILLINNMLDRYKHSISDVFISVTAGALIILNIINKFDYKELFVDFEWLSLIENSNLWKQCTDLISKSEYEYIKLKEAWECRAFK
jgi:hypothetical protein